MALRQELFVLLQILSIAVQGELGIDFVSRLDALHTQTEVARSVVFEIQVGI